MPDAGLVEALKMIKRRATEAGGNVYGDLAEAALTQPVLPREGEWVTKLRELVTLEHSYREDDNRYPRDFWHVRATIGDLSTDWTRYGKQERSEQVPEEKDEAEREALESVQQSLSPLLAAAPPSSPDRQGEVEVLNYTIKTLDNEIADLKSRAESSRDDLLRQLEEAKGEAAKRRAVWLIERGGEWYAASPHSRWTVTQAIDPSLWRENWTKDANAALHFCRKQDAEALIRFDGLQNASATEHEFITLRTAHEAAAHNSGEAGE